MPQLTLNPLDAQPSGMTWQPAGPLPIEVRRFGLFPNVDDWLPGDLVLVSHVQPDWIQRQIMEAQGRCGYAPDDAQWQHSAVYMGDAYVCEAGTSGVRYEKIANYVGSHKIRVRRDFSLTPDDRWRLAIQAVVRLGDLGATVWGTVAGLPCNNSTYESDCKFFADSGAQSRRQCAETPRADRSGWFRAGRVEPDGDAGAVAGSRSGGAGHHDGDRQCVAR